MMNSTAGSNYNLNNHDVKFELMQRHDEIVKLIVMIERVFELNLQNLNESNAEIVNLSNFFIRSMPFMENDMKMRLPGCLVIFFKNGEGR